jgi:hypothetical protein
MAGLFTSLPGGISSHGKLARLSEHFHARCRHHSLFLGGLTIDTWDPPEGWAEFRL